MPKEIVIKYQPDGTVEFEGFDFEGRSCLDASSLFAKALGVTPENSVRNMKKTPNERVEQRHVARDRISN